MNGQPRPGRWLPHLNLSLRCAQGCNSACVLAALLHLIALRDPKRAHRFFLRALKRSCAATVVGCNAALLGWPGAALLAAPPGPESLQSFEWIVKGWLLGLSLSVAAPRASSTNCALLGGALASVTHALRGRAA